MKTIRNQRHQLGSYEINKMSLSCFDDKRHPQDNGIFFKQDAHLGTESVGHIGKDSNGNRSR